MEKIEVCKPSLPAKTAPETKQGPDSMAGAAAGGDAKHAAHGEDKKPVAVQSFGASAVSSFATSGASSAAAPGKDAPAPAIAFGTPSVGDSGSGAAGKWMGGPAPATFGLSKPEGAESAAGGGSSSGPTAGDRPQASLGFGAVAPVQGSTAAVAFGAANKADSSAAADGSSVVPGGAPASTSGGKSAAGGFSFGGSSQSAGTDAQAGNKALQAPASTATGLGASVTAVTAAASTTMASSSLSSAQAAGSGFSFGASSAAAAAATSAPTAASGFSFGAAPCGSCLLLRLLWRVPWCRLVASMRYVLPSRGVSLPHWGALPCYLALCACIFSYAANLVQQVHQQAEAARRHWRRRRPQPRPELSGVAASVLLGQPPPRPRLALKLVAAAPSVLEGQARQLWVAACLVGLGAVPGRAAPAP